MKRPIELKNKICGIIGLGGIGLPFAERLKTFGMKVIGFSEETLPMVSFIDELYRGKDINDKDSNDGCGCMHCSSHKNNKKNFK